MNIKTLSGLLKENTVALITSEVNRLYFTEFKSSDGYLLVSKNGAVFITDSRYFEAAVFGAKDCNVVLQKSGREFNNQLVETIKSLGGKTVLIESERTSLLESNIYEKLFSENGLELSKSDELDKQISRLRLIKSEEEKVKILAAQRIAEKAFNKILSMIKPGVKEREIAAALDYEMRLCGADCVSFETIVATGKNSSMPHAVPGDSEVKNGDFVTLDFGATFEGYHSDTTRTVAVGKITSEMVNIYDIVFRSQKSGVEALKPGVLNSDVDKICRDIIEDCGFGENFGHSTGHGVGVEIHEAPTLYCNTNKKVDLKPGMVVTVEPGIYIPGRFGVRIEDMLMITEEGAYNFVTLPKGLITL